MNMTETHIPMQRLSSFASGQQKPAVYMATDTDKFQSHGEIESNRENNTKYFPLTAFDENGLVGFFTVRTPGDDDKKVGFGFSVIWGNK